MNVVHAGCLVGIEAHPVLVEARTGPGLPGVDIVGLPERGVRESKVRVQSALEAIGLGLPKQHLVINLAPGDLKKTGASFDLAIAVSILVNSGRIAEERVDQTILLGELSLGGELRPIRGILPHLRSARARGLTHAIIPAANKNEGALALGIDVRIAGTLLEVLEHLDEIETLQNATAGPPAPLPPLPDMADVRGQASVRRALEIAAAGDHHMLMLGPPGAGKTMLARRLPSIMPPPTPEEALAIATVASAVGRPLSGDFMNLVRPFRAPHHTASAAAMIGGGDPVRPGEVTLAHLGVLFLDELPEFRRDVIETFRTTMEEGEVCIARARQRVTMPAAPLVIAAMNPCPCGYAGDPERLCSCHSERIERYRQRISGPFVDRFDLHVAVPRVPAHQLRRTERGETSAAVAKRVLSARQVRPHARTLDELLPLTRDNALQLLDRAADSLGLSARGYVKALRIGLTLASLDGQDVVSRGHIAEAIQFRLLDRRQKTPGLRAG